jgi:hypothetical protein
MEILQPSDHGVWHPSLLVTPQLFITQLPGFAEARGISDQFRVTTELAHPFLVRPGLVNSQCIEQAPVSNPLGVLKAAEARRGVTLAFCILLQLCYLSSGVQGVPPPMVCPVSRALRSGTVCESHACE